YVAGRTGRGGLRGPRTGPSSPPIGVPLAYASRTSVDAPHLTPDRSPPKKRTTGRVPLVAYVSRRRSAEKIASREFSSAHATARPPGLDRPWSPVCRAGGESLLPW